MAIVEVSIAPLGLSDTSLSEYVADTIKILEQSGLQFQLTSMGTIIEGDLDEILSTIRQMHESPYKKGMKRVVTNVKIDDRRDKAATSKGKVESVYKKMG
ncbi:MAG: MTH1187 family thiamine-binding protein [Thermodesulfobacteriota bacterium]|nr:MTH1187 family thiamine-binding protein [Thermodesulfobacteriota bacterium]